MKPFRKGWPGSIWMVSVPCRASNSLSAFSRNSGPLSLRIYIGAPRSENRSVSMRVASRARIDLTTLMARPSRANSSSKVMIFGRCPLADASNLESYLQAWWGIRPSSESDHVAGVYFSVASRAGTGPAAAEAGGKCCSEKRSFLTKVGVFYFLSGPRRWRLPGIPARS